MTDCTCFRCIKARTDADPAPEMAFGQPVALIRMFLCENCGNKRCPHAADHELACSGSNAPGQAGSLYEDTPPAGETISAARNTAVNQAAADGLRALCHPLIEADAEPTDFLVALESLVVGGFLMVVKLGGDEPVIDVFADRLRERLATLRLGAIRPAGEA